jgi:iron complex outermembrane receptor protein
MRVNFTGFPGPQGLPVMAGIITNPNFDDEHMMSYEAGYRTTVVENLSLDVATFYNFYSNRPTMEPVAPYLEPVPAPPHLLLPVTERNLMSGETHGVEVAANWKVTDRWILSPGYAFQGIHMYLRPPSADWGAILIAQGSSPVHSAQLRSHVNLTPTLSWDSSTYFVDRLKSGPIPGYTRVDTGVTWRPGKTLALSIFGQNLADSEHLEFIDNLNSVKSTLVGRSFHAEMTWTF